MARKMSSEAVDLGRRLGENLVQFRKRVGLSQAAAAERAGLHRTEIGFIETGKRVPRLDTIVKLAGAVEVQPCALLLGMSWQLDPPREGSK